MITYQGRESKIQLNPDPLGHDTPHTEVDGVQSSHFTAKGLHDQGCHCVSDMAGSLLAPSPGVENHLYLRDDTHRLPVGIS